MTGLIWLLLASITASFLVIGIVAAIEERERRALTEEGENQ